MSCLCTHGNPLGVVKSAVLYDRHTVLWPSNQRHPKEPGGAGITSSLAVTWPMYLMAVYTCTLALDSRGAILHAKDVQLLYTFV